MIYSESGLVERGAIFSTPDVKSCVLKVTVKPKNENSSFVDIVYTYTGLGEAGNTFVKNFTKRAFLEAVTFWEKSINHFLKTGKMLKKG